MPLDKDYPTRDKISKGVKKSADSYLKRSKKQQDQLEEARQESQAQFKRRLDIMNHLKKKGVR